MVASVTAPSQYAALVAIYFLTEAPILRGLNPQISPPKTDEPEEPDQNGINLHKKAVGGETRKATTAYYGTIMPCFGTTRAHRRPCIRCAEVYRPWLGSSQRPGGLDIANELN